MTPSHNPACRLLAIAAVAVLVGCNSGDVTKSSTVPPIAGVVGGPDAPGGTGAVGVEVRADAASVVSPSAIVVKNLDRDTEDGIAEVPEGGLEFALLSIKGDVGDRLRVTLEHPDEGTISRDFEITPPKITEVRDPEGPEPVIHAGVAAQITGSGFSTGLGASSVELDGATHIETSEEVRPGLLYFMVPPGALPGTHTVRVLSAGTEGGDASYASEEFTVTLE